MFDRKITLRKEARKTLQIEKIKEQIKKIKDRVLTATREQRGWKIRVDPRNYIPKQFDKVYEYYVDLKVACSPPRERKLDHIENEFTSILRIIAETGGSAEWYLHQLDDKAIKAEELKVSLEMGYTHVEIPDNFTTFFSTLFNREDQIECVRSSLEAAITSEFEDRFHTVLVGDPAGGKSQLLRCLKSALGDDACLEYDATATTAAGAIKDITDRTELPRILIVEEIEKVDDDDGKSLRWLLSMLDQRAEIKKVTAKEQYNVHKTVRMLCFATVNDYDKFEGMMSGALASRFPNVVYCPRPDRQLLEKILERDITRAKGDVAWIKPTLDYCEAKGISDPRRVTSICLCGKNRLITGEYQKILDRTNISNFIRKK